MERPELDEAKAPQFIGKSVLIGVAYRDNEGNLIDQREWFGTILTYSNKYGIRVRIRNSKDTCVLPPDPEGLQKAKPGIYRLRSTGEEVTNPDYTAVLTRVGGNDEK
ncbi:MAG: hypothetical protein U1E05_00470 [Patescibacteria group bacterium]|nr:hypothetical protein [Patescibacteria group bacterium]